MVSEDPRGSPYDPTFREGRRLFQAEWGNTGTGRDVVGAATVTAGSSGEEVRQKMWRE